MVAEWSGVRCAGAVTDEADTAVLALTVRALLVGACERLGLAAWLDATHLLLAGKPRQILDVTGVDTDAPDAADEELTIASPQVPRQTSGVVHGSHEEKRS